MAVIAEIATLAMGTMAMGMMVMQIALALLAGLAAGSLVLVAALVAPALSRNSVGLAGFMSGLGLPSVGGRAGTRIRAGLGSRARTIVLPRRRRGRLATLWADLGRALLGDMRGPVGPGLVARRPAAEGIPRLRWLLLHAGCGHRSIAWLRRQQAEAMLATLLAGGTVGLALGLAPPAYALLVPPGLVIGYRLPTVVLARRARARRARLRTELVTLLYGLASLVVRGRPVERALDRLALRPGELAREVAFARELHFNGLPMGEALEVLAARCGSEEVRDAMSLAAATLGGAVALERAAVMFKDLADSIRVMIDEGRREELAYAVLRFTGVGTVFGLLVAATTVLYPVISQAIRSLL